MKKISAKSMLSFMTASAIVVTMAGSYAVWDQLTAVKEATLTLDQPVTVSIDELQAFAATENRTLGTARTYSTDVKFDVANVGDNYNGLSATLIAKVTQKDKADIDLSDQFNIVIKEGDSVLAEGKDSSVEAANNYKVEITPKDDSDASELIKNGELTVEITGELSGTITPVA